MRFLNLFLKNITLNTGFPKSKSRTFNVGVLRPGFPITFQRWPCIQCDHVVSWILLKELPKKTLLFTDTEILL